LGREISQKGSETHVKGKKTKKRRRKREEGISRLDSAEGKGGNLRGLLLKDIAFTRPNKGI